MYTPLTRSCVVVLLFSRIALASPQQAAEVERLVKAAPRTHPRLFLNSSRMETVKQKVAADPTLTKALAYIRAFADAIETERPVVRKKVGRRLLGVSRTCLERVCHLAFAYRMTGETKYLKRAEAEMLAASGFRDWNPSHFLDVAEMTAALAIGYDWLHDDLSASARTTIRDAIVEKGLTPSLRGGWWVDTSNNWNQVCHGGLCLGALAVLEDEPELATKIITRAVNKLPRAMAEYAPDGAYPEGPGYWKYGTTYNVLLIAAFQSVLGTDFGLTKSKGFLASADYYLHVTGPTGLFFNYSDCGSRGGISPAMYWFAARRNTPWLLWHEKPALADFLATANPKAGRQGRLFPFLLIWCPNTPDLGQPPSRHWKAAGRTPVGMHRSGWTSDATFVAIKGGSPGSNHAHMDIGSFVMDAGGVRWALDLGSQSYESLESKGIKLWDRSQSSQRWDVFRLNNFAHNTLVVDGKKQVVKASAAITSFVADGPMPHTIVDMTPVYRGQLASAKRGIGLRADRSALVQDEIATLEHETSVRWGMITRAKVESIHGATAVLARRGKHLTLTVLAPAGARLETYETAAPPAAYDAANRGTRMIGFELRLPASTRHRLAVLLTPGTGATEKPRIMPLADW